MREFHTVLIALFIVTPLITVVILESYIAHRYLERYEALLTNCVFIKENKHLFQHTGLPGKVLRIVLIACVLAAPRLFIRKSLIDVEEVKRFPARTRRLLVILLCIHCGSFLALIIVNYFPLIPDHSP